MKRKMLTVLTVITVMLTAIVFPLKAHAANYSSEAIADYAYQVAAIVNRERAANGLAPLKYSDQLSEAAIIRAQEIQTYFSHTRPNGTSCFTAVTENGIRYRAVGENIAYGQRDPEAVMDAWMHSSGHRANILGANYEYIGIGVTYRNGVYYWSQFFAASDNLTGYVISADAEQSPAETTAPPETTAAAVTTATTAAPQIVTTRTETAPLQTVPSETTVVTSPETTRTEPEIPSDLPAEGSCSGLREIIQKLLDQYGGEALCRISRSVILK